MDYSPIPFYYSLKLFFLLWLYQTRVSDLCQAVYTSHVILSDDVCQIMEYLTCKACFYDSFFHNVFFFLVLQSCYLYYFSLILLRLKPVQYYPEKQWQSILVHQIRDYNPIMFRFMDAKVMVRTDLYKENIHHDLKILQLIDLWKSHTNLTHPGKYFRPSKVKIMRPTSPK